MDSWYVESVIKFFFILIFFKVIMVLFISIDFVMIILQNIYNLFFDHLYFIYMLQYDRLYRLFNISYVF
jgi:hypothetical protein